MPVGAELDSRTFVNRLSGGSRSLDAGRALGGARGISLGGAIGGRVGVLVLLARGVNSDLDSDLAALDLLAVHIGTGLLLHLLGGEGNKTEATALARLVAGLKLTDHKLGDRTEGNLGGGRLVLSEDFEKLDIQVSMMLLSSGHEGTYLLLAEVVREVGNHNLGLAGDAVLGRTTLLAGTVGVGLAVDSEAVLASGGGQGLVGGLSERSSLARDVGGGAVGGILALDGALGGLTLLATTAASSTATTATAATAGGLAATGSALTALGDISSRLRLAGELDRDLAVKNGLAVQLLDGTVGLGRGGDVNEGVADRASGARVGGDRGGLTVEYELVSSSFKSIKGCCTYTR